MQFEPIFQIPLAARDTLDNFEISLAVLLPNTTTSHAITYTYTPSFQKRNCVISDITQFLTVFSPYGPDNEPD